MPLEEYRRKRNFGRTPEPAGAVAAGAAASSGRFVVQRHRATRLHYDFRLEIDGVLVWWAVPRGPTLDPAARRMAVHVEDHPIEYLDFEGVIPKGQYGAGDVIVWDWGTWEAEAETPDRARGVADGELKFRLDGQKLSGRFTIVAGDAEPGAEARARRGSRRAPVRGRRGGAMAAHPQAGRARDCGLGCGGPPEERQDRPDERRGGPTGTPYWVSRGAGRRRREIDLRAAASRRRCRRSSSRWPRRSPTGRSATRTGCSR